jgi:hypothetical protein
MWDRCFVVISAQKESPEDRMVINQDLDEGERRDTRALPRREYEKGESLREKLGRMREGASETTSDATTCFTILLGVFGASHLFRVHPGSFGFE